ncbi:MAG: MFS transporter [Dongiaceae bacterium]
MFAALRSVASLLLGACILILGNSLLGILLPIRMGVEDLSPEIAGVVMSAYYFGLVGGSLWGKRIIARVGHIRAFAAFAAGASAATLLHALWYDPIPWALLRVLSGFCMAALFAAIESWLNMRSSNETRGQVLSLYVVVAYVGSSAGQFLVNYGDVQALQPFMLVALLLTVSLIPVVMTRVAGPEIGASARLSLAKLYRISPVGVVGCVVSGIITGAFYGMGAIYAQNLGYSVFEVSLFMGVTVIGGLIAQWPIGRLSDKFDRRTVMFFVLLVLAAACVANYGLALRPDMPLLPILILIGIFGGAAASVYPLAVAHACDYVEQPQMLAASSGLLLSWALGSAAGPVLGSLVMGQFADPALFLLIAAAGLFLAIFVRYRMSRRIAKPSDEQTNFVPVSTIALAPTELDPRSDTPEGEVLPPDHDRGATASA